MWLMNKEKEGAKKMKMEMVASSNARSVVRDMVIYFVLGLGCLIGSGYVSDVWHDTFLSISVVLLIGGGAAFFALILDWRTQRKAKEVAGEQDKLQ